MTLFDNSYVSEQGHGFSYSTVRSINLSTNASGNATFAYLEEEPWGSDPGTRLSATASLTDTYKSSEFAAKFVITDERSTGGGPAEVQAVGVAPAVAAQIREDRRARAEPQPVEVLPQAAKALWIPAAAPLPVAIQPMEATRPLRPRESGSGGNSGGTDDEPMQNGGASLGGQKAMDSDDDDDRPDAGSTGSSCAHAPEGRENPGLWRTIPLGLATRFRWRRAR